MIAIGVLDVFGFVGVVEALDVCLKTADVRFLESENMKGGLVSVVIEGDVSAVSASISAGVEASQKRGGYRGHTIIARVDDQVESMLGHRKSPHHKGELIQESPKNHLVSEDSSGVNEDDLLEESEGHEELGPVSEAKKGPQGSFREKLDAMSVPELRRIARQSNLKTMNKNTIKRARKSELIERILLEKMNKE